MLHDEDSLLDVCLKVLIIGGGDGGIARELDRYPAVKEVVLCEIDEVCKIVLYTVLLVKEIAAAVGIGQLAQAPGSV